MLPPCLYALRTSFITNNENKEINASIVKQKNITLKEKWHRILGHVNFQYLQEICRKGLLNDLPKELEKENKNVLFVWKVK